MSQVQDKLQILTILFAALVKHGSFKCENEWRLLALTNERFDPSLVTIIGGKPRLPFHVLGRDREAREAVREVVVSPHGLTRMNIATAKLICRKYASTKTIAIRQSKSPYNGL